MKRKRAFFLACLLCTVWLGGLAESVSLKTTSTFAGADAAAETYVNLLKAWQEKTGNTVTDFSASADEAWKTAVLKDFAAGNEADVFFFFAKTADSVPILPKVVPISEINAAYPDLHLTETASLDEADGLVYAIPVRAFWEGLFCNVDLFTQYGVELPTTWEKLLQAIDRFNQAGIVPISVSLSDRPHYIAEFCILSAGSPVEHLRRPQKGEPVPESWIAGMELLRILHERGAFPKEVNATTEAATSQMFREKRSAMQIDGSWFANGLPPENMDSTIVLPFPAYSPAADPTVVVGGISMGFYLSRAAWEDETKRAAAVDLLAFLTTGSNAAALGGYAFTGAIAQSAAEMVSNAHAIHPPFQDSMDPEARSAWFGSVAGIADGSVDPAQMWETVMAMDPFGLP